jgi:hypothetical protein
MDLARPVKLGGREETARFRIVQLENKSLFVCQHLTRELVWRPEWQSHANGASELSLVALAPDQPFEGLPASIHWRASPTLFLKSAKRVNSVEAHGVRLVFS